MSTGTIQFQKDSTSSRLRSLFAAAFCCALSLNSAMASELVPGYASQGMLGGGIAGEVQAVPVGTMAAQAPAQGARPDDPVYDAWEEFLKRRGPAQAGAVQALPAQALMAQQAQALGVPVGAQGLLATVAQDQFGTAQLGTAPLGAPGVSPDQATQGTSLTSTLTQGGLSTDSWPGGLLATVLGGMGLAGAYVARRRMPKLGEWLKAHGAGGKNPNRVRVLSVSPLSAQGSLAVVDVGGQVLVLGVTSGRVSLLTRLDQNGLPVVTPTLERELDEPEAPVVAKEAPKAAPATRSAVAQDFSALLSNLTKESSEASPNPNSPLARYAAMNALKKETSVEPPSEDMATQVLRKMKTMKRFRSAA